MKISEYPNLFSGSQIPETTQQAIIDYFQFRDVVDDEKFPVFFKRVLAIRENQYLGYLRVETVQFDPMVADYMEREHKNLRTATEESTGTKQGEATNKGDGTRSVLTNTEGTSTANTEGSSTGNSTASGTSANEGTTTGTNAQDTTTTNKTRSLAGTTPDSQLFPEAGFPEALNWHFASTQSESATEATQKVTGTTGNTEKSNGTTSSTEDTTQTNKASSTASDTGKTTTTYTDGTTGSTTNNESNTNKSNSAETGEETERYSGRHEAPQDLLERARDYIIATNAFKWLVDKLDSCFMAVYEI